MRADELWHRGLHGRGYRLTIPRKAILEVLSNSDDHLSAEDIYITVHNLYPAIGLTTVYWYKWEWFSSLTLEMVVPDTSL